MRKATGLLMILASLIFYGFALSTPASADPNGPGNNGTVKIVNDGDDAMGADDRDNDPHVCKFHMYGFHFDNKSSGTWQIESWPPTGNRTVVASGTWKADGTGQWAVAGPALADGHYELDAKQTVPGTPGSDKNKVFWVKCGATGGTGPTGSTGATGPTGSTGGTENNNNNNGGSNTTTENGTASGPNGIVMFTPGNSANSNGNANGNSNVAGFESASGGSNQQSPNGAVNGVQTSPVAGVQGLPSTSTDGTPAMPLAFLGLGIMALGGALLRRGHTRI